MNAPVCPFNLCDGTGAIVTYPEPTRIYTTTCPCSPPAAPPPADPWSLAPPGLNPDEAPLQLEPDLLDEPDPDPEETPW